MYVVCIDVLSFSRRASKEAEQRNRSSCRKTASAQHNRSAAKGETPLTSASLCDSVKVVRTDPKGKAWYFRVPHLS